MPINVLYCEGSPKGIDIRVISQLAPRGCVVRALGGKTSSFMESVIADRKISGNLAGLVDRDFDCEFQEIANAPLNAFYHQLQIGWSWERKEIENYLIDPRVVQKAWGTRQFSHDEYQTALNRAVDHLRIYTAARTALSCYRFKNYWGDEIRDFASKYYFPKDLTTRACETKIEEIVHQYRGDRIVTSQDVLNKMQVLLPEFRAGGYRLEHSLTFFSGKDLLCAMRASFLEWGIDPKQPIQAFLERIVHSIERADEVWTWLPEWSALRELLSQVQFAD